MLKKLVDIFAGLPMTVVSGASLLLSLFLPAAGALHIFLHIQTSLLMHKCTLSLLYSLSCIRPKTGAQN